jgi:hypothetical protein
LDFISRCPRVCRLCGVYIVPRSQIARKTAKQNEHHRGAGFVGPKNINWLGFGLSNAFFHKFLYFIVRA